MSRCRWVKFTKADKIKAAAYRDCEPEEIEEFWFSPGCEAAGYGDPEDCTCPAKDAPLCPTCGQAIGEPVLHVPGPDPNDDEIAQEDNP